MKKKHWIVLTVIVALLVGVFSGCNGSGSETDIRLDIDLSVKPALKFLVPNAGESDPNFNSSKPFEVIQEVTGYSDVRFEQQPTVNIEDKLNTVFVSRAKFDAIKITKEQFDALLSKDVLLDISPALDKFGPNLLANISKESWDSVTHNGAIYGIPERNATEAVDMGLIFNKADLKKVGITTLPTTPAELKTTLQALKDGSSDPTYAPLSFTKENVVIPAIATAFGVPDTWGEKGTDLQYYIEDENTKAYVEYMSELRAANLIDIASLQNQTTSQSLQKFAEGKVSVVAAGYWNVPELLQRLGSKNIIDVSGNKLDTSTFEYLLGYVSALEDATGKITKWRSGGISYVTVFPFYMTENAAYVVDWLDQRIKTDNFRRTVIGDQDVHYTIDADGNYTPTTAFSAFNYASSYLMGVDEKNYEKYWLARVQKTKEMNRMWQALKVDVDTVGVFSPAMYAPPLIKSAPDKVRP